MSQRPTEPQLQIEATPYFRRVQGILRRDLRLRLPQPYSGPCRVELEMAAETSDDACDADQALVTVAGPSEFAGTSGIRATVRTPAGTWSASATIPATRLWTVYIAQDKHLDYAWIHSAHEVIERANSLSDYYLAASESIGLRWNFDVSIWVEEYLRARPAAQRERLLAALRQGRMEVGAVWLVPFAGIQGTEEVLRSLYFARRLRDQYGIPVTTANLQEVPTLPWGLATILAGAGLPFIVKGAYHLRNPHLKERRPFPLFHWEGPDGSRVLVRWDDYEDTHSWGGYAEAYKLWRAESDGERQCFVEATIARYEGYGGYPIDAILLAGTGFDEYPQTTAVSDFIRQFNEQGWEYPKLVDATWSQYWAEAGEANPTPGPSPTRGGVIPSFRDGTGAGGLGLPVARGDWGNSWEEWPSQLAHLNSVYRRARESVLAGQALSALALALDPRGDAGRREALALAWCCLLQFSDHNIGGMTPQLADDMRDRKCLYAYTAWREGERALASGLGALAASVPAPHSYAQGFTRLLLVANPCSWPRTSPIEVMVPDPGLYRVSDSASGEQLPCRVEKRGGWPEHYLAFLAPDVPGFGYRTFLVERLAEATPAPAEPEDAHALETDFYRLELDPQTGSLLSLYDKEAGRELITAGRVGLNEYLHFSEGTLHRSHLETSKRVEDGISRSIVVEATALRAKLRSTYRLYHGSKRLEIANELVKEPTEELQASWFAFPLGQDGGQYRYDGPAAIVRPGLQEQGGDMLPGAGRTCLSVQSFLATSGDNGTIVLATPDAHLMQLGPQVLAEPLADSDPASPLALSLVMHNFTRNDRATNQGGQANFSFRYAITSYAGGFAPVEAVRFGKEIAQPLPVAWVIGGEGAPLPAGNHRFLAVSPGNVVATGLKPAEDERGWVLRLWEVGGQDCEATVDASAMGVARAWRCDLLEGDLEELQLQGGTVRVDMPAFGLRAVRIARSEEDPQYDFPR